MKRFDEFTKGVTINWEKDQSLNPGNSRIERSRKRKGPSTWEQDEAARPMGAHLRVVSSKPSEECVSKGTQLLKHISYRSASVCDVIESY